MGGHAQALREQSERLRIEHESVFDRNLRGLEGRCTHDDAIAALFGIAHRFPSELLELGEVVRGPSARAVLRLFAGAARRRSAVGIDQDGNREALNRSHAVTLRLTVLLIS